jgi:large subunit ribosomal protein L29
MATANDLRQMTPEEIARLVREQRDAGFNLRLKRSTGHLENSALLPKSRRDMARLLTVQNETRLGIAHAYKAGLPKKADRKAAEAAPEKADKPKTEKAKAAEPAKKKTKKAKGKEA